MASGKPLFTLFDGNAPHRVLHALLSLTITKTGEMINAVQGFASTLLKLLPQTDYEAFAVFEGLFQQQTNQLLAYNVYLRLRRSFCLYLPPSF